MYACTSEYLWYDIQQFHTTKKLSEMDLKNFFIQGKCFKTLLRVNNNKSKTWIQFIAKYKKLNSRIIKLSTFFQVNNCLQNFILESFLELEHGKFIIIFYNL